MKHEFAQEQLDSRVVIERLGENGEVLEVSYGPTLKQRMEAHENNECDAMCSFCYTDACEWPPMHFLS